MKRKLIQLANERMSHLLDWLSRKKEEAKYIKVANDIVDQTGWEIKMIEHLPSSVIDKLAIPSLDTYEKQNEYLFDAYKIDPLPINTLAGTASISSASSTDLVSGLVHSKIDLSPWINNEINDFIQIQEKQGRFSDVVTRFNSINPLLADELIKSRDAYISAKQNITEKTYAGIALRNVIEHFKGELFSKLPKGFRGKKKWVDMVNTLSIGTPGSIEFNTLLQLEKKYDQLHADLTGYAKNLSQPVNFTFDNIWAIYVDFLFVITGLIKI